MARRFLLVCVLGLLGLAGTGPAAAASPAGGAARSARLAADAARWLHLRPAVRHAARHPARRSVRHVAGTAYASRLRFGVYPWANAGAIAQVDPALADQPFKALSAVQQLQGSRSMTVHLYGQYTGTDPREADALISDATWWSANGVGVEMVLRYRPAGAQLAGGFVPWVATVARRLAAISGVHAIQVGNEANNTASAAAGDGAYPGAVAALAAGIPAARAAVIAAGRADIRIGFNWAAGQSPCQLDPFFASLRRAGGQAFAASVQWVGIDVYPGTWSAPSRSVFPTTALIQSSVESSLSCLRTLQMPAAGLGPGVTITVAETGYPTDARRTEATQVAVLRALVAAVLSVSRPLGVTDLRWFDLRDANTASGQLENGYGLMRDDYSPKPAFTAFADLVASNGV